MPVVVTTNPLSRGDELGGMEDVELSGTIGASSSSTPQPHLALSSGRRASNSSRGEGARAEKKVGEKASARKETIDSLQIVQEGEGLSYPEKQRYVAAAPCRITPKDRRT